MSKDGLAVGHRARFVRRGTVIADGRTIGYLPDEGALGSFLRTGPGGGVNGSFEVRLDFPDLRMAGRTDPYQVLDLRGGPDRDWHPVVAADVTWPMNDESRFPQVKCGNRLIIQGCPPRGI